MFPAYHHSANKEQKSPNKIVILHLILSRNFNLSTKSIILYAQALKLVVLYAWSNNDEDLFLIIDLKSAIFLKKNMEKRFIFLLFSSVFISICLPIYPLIIASRKNETEAPNQVEKTSLDSGENHSFQTKITYGGLLLDAIISPKLLRKTFFALERPFYCLLFLLRLRSGKELLQRK